MSSSVSRRRTERPFVVQSSPNMGKDRTSTATAVLAAAGAVVVIVNEATEFPLPAPTWEGLNVQIDRLGKFVHAKVALLGKLLVLGLTATLKSADCPTGMEVDVGVAVIAKSKLWTGIAVNVTGAECEVATESLPAALMLKL